MAAGGDESGTERARPAETGGRSTRAPGWLEARRTGLLLGSIVLLGALVRLYRLTERTFTHPEMFLPYMDVPPWASAPPAYRTLSELVVMVLRIDVHPPGFWAFMWGWMGVVGTGLLDIRLPLVLAGLAALLLTYRLAAVDDGPVVGLLAAALLAVNGNHVYYSQIGRKYGILVVLALLSIVLLRRVRARGDLPARIGYVATTAFGVWCAHVFWLFLAGQVLWVLAEGIRRGRFPAALWSPCAAGIAGSPAVFYMAHQWGRAEYMEASPASHLLELLMFGGLFQIDRVLDDSVRPVAIAAIVLLALAGTVCLVAGMGVRRRLGKVPPEGAPAAEAGARDAAVALVVPVAYFSWNWTVVGHGIDQLLVLGLAALGIPALVGLRRIWPRLGGASRERFRFHPGLDRLIDDPVAFHLVSVALVMSLVSLVGHPVASSRTMLFLGPLATIVMARGVVRLASTPPRRVAAGVALAAVGVSAVVHVETRPEIHDYRALAERMEPRMREGDAVVIEDHWYTQPIYYHLPWRRFRTMRPEDLRRTIEETRRDPGSRPERVWLVTFGESPYLEGRVEELVGILDRYRRIDAVDARHARALLYERVRWEAAAGERR